jgi:hypothetical protein
MAGRSACGAGNQADTLIAGDILEFIQSSFKSIWSLELLLFLQRSADRAWSIPELVRELRGSEHVVRQSLTSLLAAGLVSAEANEVFRYLPASSDLDRLVSETARAYRERPGTVRQAILSAPNEKLRTFADAFRLKKD